MSENTTIATEKKQLPKRSEAYVTKSLTPEAVKVTEEFGWDFFKAGVLLTDEWTERIGDNDPEVLYHLVREAKVKEKQPDGSSKWVTSDKGKWNIPCGRLRKWESFAEAAIRECIEETGFEPQLQELCHIGHRFDIDNPYVLYIYSTWSWKNVGKPNSEEIAEGGWFTYDEILELQKNNLLRNPDLTLGAINQYRTYKNVPKEFLVTYTSKFEDDTK